MKSYTDLEQSRKLAEILPFESADYHYIEQGEKSYFYPYSLSSDVVKDYDEEIKYIPCWSLAALLSVLPDFHLNKYVYNDGTSVYYVTSLVTGEANTKYYDNPVDACYDIILKCYDYVCTLL